MDARIALPIMISLALAGCNDSPMSSQPTPLTPTSITREAQAPVTGRYRATFTHRDRVDELSITVRQEGQALSGTWNRENGEGEGTFSGSVDSSSAPFPTVNVYIANSAPIADYYHVVGAIVDRDAALIRGQFVYVGERKGAVALVRE